MNEPIPESVETREDFIAFVQQLAKDFEEHGDDWENITVDRYLEALASWTEDMGKHRERFGDPFPTPPTWALFAEILRAAKGYE
jgi:hypothetical protein